jgi:Domain of unknown function (DUF4116)
MSLAEKKALALELVSKFGLNLSYDPICKEFTDDIDVVLAAINNNASAFQYASDTLKNNKEVILAAVTKNGYLLKFVPIPAQTQEVVLAAVRQNGCAIMFAEPIWQENKDVVLAAVTQNGLALMGVHSSLRNDPEIRLRAASDIFGLMMFGGTILSSVVCCIGLVLLLHFYVAPFLVLGGLVGFGMFAPKMIYHQASDNAYQEGELPFYASMALDIVAPKNL